MNCKRNAETHRRLPWLPVLAVSVLVGCTDGPQWRDPKVEEARALTQKSADQLDRQTDQVGGYIQHPKEDLDETDPWGTPLKVAYSRDGVSEVLTVRSAGPDKRFDTPDDIVAQRIAVSFKGAGEGIRQNAEEVSERAARGAVRGAAQGVREQVRGAVRLNRDAPDPVDD